VDNKSNVVIKIPSRDINLSAEKWKVLGNDKFKEKDYESAIECYETALEHAKLSLRIKCLTNIALCELRLERFESALKRCNEALLLDSNDQKAIYRKIFALTSLREHATASALLSQHMSKEKNDAAWEKLQNRVTRRAKEALGVHNEQTIALVSAGSKDVEMFVGAIEVKTSKGKGRGVFATEEIRRGDLIIFEKGIFFENDFEKTKSTTFAFDFDTKLTNTASQVGLIEAMIKESEIPIIGKRLSYLYDGTETSKQAIPPMCLFKSDRCDEQYGKHILSKAKAQGIQTFNSFGNQFDGKNKENSCLYPLISFINTASGKSKKNTMRITIGTHFMAIYAASNIQKGAEIIIDYAEGKYGKVKADLLKKYGVNASTRV